MIKALSKLDVITLFVEDLDESKAFYTGAGGSRALLTIEVDDANAVCAELQAHGVTLLNGPTDRPWGRRTAAFADPAGNTWEIAQDLS
jgi:catechol 2,3-dioxygenase-like lactoylglutathione lyase family enzyme